jgi:hypothetical protein
MLIEKRLTKEQHDALVRCARGASLRFEERHIVDALVSGGYAENNIGGVVRVTAEGVRYLQNYRVGQAGREEVPARSLGG